MKAAQYLGQILRLDAKINRKLAEKRQVMELVTKVTPSLTDMPRGGGGADKIGDAVARLCALEEEIDRIVDELIDARAEVLKLIGTLPDKEQQVLHGYYVQGLTIERIADNFKPVPKSSRQVSRIKSRAVKRVQAILDEENGAKTTN